MRPDLDVPLAKVRLPAEREELAEKWNELSTFEIGLQLNRVFICFMN